MGASSSSLPIQHAPLPLESADAAASTSPPPSTSAAPCPTNPTDSGAAEDGGPGEALVRTPLTTRAGTSMPCPQGSLQATPSPCHHSAASPARRRRPSRTTQRSNSGSRRSLSRSINRAAGHADHRKAEVHSQPATRTDATADSSATVPVPAVAAASAPDSSSMPSKPQRRSATIPREKDCGRRTPSKGRSRSAPRRSAASCSTDDVPLKSILKKKQRRQSPAKTLMTAVTSVGFSLGSAAATAAGTGKILDETVIKESDKGAKQRAALAAQSPRSFSWALCCRRRRPRKSLKETKKHITFKPTMRVVEFQRRLGPDAVPQDGSKVALGLGKKLRAYVAPLANPSREAAAALIEDHCYIPVRERLQKLRKSMGQIPFSASILRHNQQNAKVLARRKAAKEDVETKLYQYMPISSYDARSRARLVQREAARQDE